MMQGNSLHCALHMVSMLYMLTIYCFSLFLVFYLTLTTTLKDVYYYAHFTDNEAET